MANESGTNVDERKLFTVRFKTGYAPFNASEIAGFPLLQAFALCEAGKADPVGALGPLYHQRLKAGLLKMSLPEEIAHQFALQGFTPKALTRNPTLVQQAVKAYNLARQAPGKDKMVKAPGVEKMPAPQNPPAPATPKSGTDAGSAGPETPCAQSASEQS